MYNQYNPYINRFYGQQQANMPQPMEMSMQQQNTPQMALNRQNILYGKQVDSLARDFTNLFFYAIIYKRRVSLWN